MTTKKQDFTEQEQPLFVAANSKKTGATRAKKPAIVDTNITTVSVTSKNISHWSQMPPLPNVFGGYYNNLPVLFQQKVYVKDDSGKDTKEVECILNHIWLDGRHIVEIDNLIMSEDMSDMVVDDEKFSTITRAARVKVTGDMVEIAQVPLGAWRSHFLKSPLFSDILTGVRCYFDRETGKQLESDKSGNVDYRTTIMAKTNNKDAAVQLIKDIVKKNAKAGKALEWFELD